MCAHDYWLSDVNVYVVVLDIVYKYNCTVYMYMFYIGDTMGSKSSKSKDKGQPSTSGKQGISTTGTHEGNVQCHAVLGRFACYLVVLAL